MSDPAIPPDPGRLQALASAFRRFIELAEPLGVEATGHEDRTTMHQRASAAAWAVADARHDFTLRGSWESSADFEDLYFSIIRADDEFEGALRRAGFVKGRITGVTLDHSNPVETRHHIRELDEATGVVTDREEVRWEPGRVPRREPGWYFAGPLVDREGLMILPAEAVAMKRCLATMEEFLSRLAGPKAGERIDPPMLDPATFVPSEPQARMLEALEYKALKLDPWSKKSYVERRNLIRLKIELQDNGLIQHHPRLGFYRPDKPPPQLCTKKNQIDHQEGH